MRKRLAIIFLLSAVAAFAQDQRQVQVNVGGPGPAPRRQAPEPKKMTPEQLKRGHEWMAAAEAQAKGLEGGTRAYALLQVAKSFGPDQKAHALELLEDALTASKSIEDDQMHIRTSLQQKILQAMVPLDPGRADELLTTLDPAGRESVLKALLAYYRNSKQQRHALEMIYRISAESEFPYGAGAEMMREMPKSQQGELQQMFTTALESYRNHKHPGMTMGRGDFAAMITEFYKQLSPDVVKDAIAEVLKQAEAPPEEGQQPMRVSVASANGSVAMSSPYEYRLFQLEPTLRAVDPDEADRLLKKNREVAGMLEKYPQGADQVAGSRLGEQQGPGGGAMMMVGDGPPGGMDNRQMVQMQKIQQDAATHPQDALANAGTLTSPQLKAQALEGIARQTWKKDAGVARSALKQLVELVPQLPPQEQIMPMRAAASLYLEMGEPDEARKTIEKGLESAAQLYKLDTDANDPNKALEAYWPSTNAYAGLLQLAAQIEPNWALEQLKSVPDDEIRAVAHVAMASALLGRPAGEVVIMTETKGNNSVMQMTQD